MKYYTLEMRNYMKHCTLEMSNMFENRWASHSKVILLVKLPLRVIKHTCTPEFPPVLGQFFADCFIFPAAPFDLFQSFLSVGVVCMIMLCHVTEFNKYNLIQTM